jgi:hypothetical protein
MVGYQYQKRSSQSCAAHANGSLTKSGSPNAIGINALATTSRAKKSIIGEASMSDMSKAKPNANIAEEGRSRVPRP